MSGIDSSESDENTIPLCVPEIRGNEWSYVKECLDTNWVSSAGAYVERFEREFAEYVGVEHAVAVVNGTSALHVALRLAGVEPEDEVLMSTLTFIAPANAARYLGAWPTFVDAEPDYWQMDVEAVDKYLDEQCRRSEGELIDEETGRRVSAIMPVHILGHPVEMGPLQQLAEEYDLPIIEDASESLGARCEGRSVGSWGEIGCFSFNGNKLMTTGGGGMLVTDDEELAEQARYLTKQAKDDPFEYVHEEIGYNYRLTNVQAAMGCAQLEQIDSYVDKKRQIAERYREGLGEVAGLEPMPEAEWAESVFWLYTVRIEPEVFGMDRPGLHEFLQARGVQSRPLWQPMHQSPAHADGPPGCIGGGEVAEELKAQAVSLPCSVGLTEEEQQRVIRLLQSVEEPR